MDLKPTFVFRPQPPLQTPVHLPFPELPNPLGPLSYLPGKWTGTGFNMIWRPLFHDPTGAQDHYLELNLTNETIDFALIEGAIPNRGLLQDDINMYGADLTSSRSATPISARVPPAHGARRLALVPPTPDPAEPQTVVRMATIPHGTSILIQGTANSGGGRADAFSADQHGPVL